MIRISRKIGQRIYIEVPNYPTISVTILGEVSENIFDIAIDAPQETKVLREELVLKKYDASRQS